MEAIFTIIIQQAAIWAPSLVAIFGVIAMIVKGLGECRSAIKELKEDKTLKELSDKLTTLSQENQELQRCNKLLLDRITKIQGYADALKKGD